MCIRWRQWRVCRWRFVLNASAITVQSEKLIVLVCDEVATSTS
jgi:hypothetical protein